MVSAQPWNVTVVFVWHAIIILKIISLTFRVDLNRFEQKVDGVVQMESNKRIHWQKVMTGGVYRYRSSAGVRHRITTTCRYYSYGIRLRLVQPEGLLLWWDVRNGPPKLPPKTFELGAVAPKLQLRHATARECPIGQSFTVDVTVYLPYRPHGFYARNRLLGGIWLVVLCKTSDTKTLDTLILYYYVI